MTEYNCSGPDAASSEVSCTSGQNYCCYSGACMPNAAGELEIKLTSGFAKCGEKEVLFPDGELYDVSPDSTSGLVRIKGGGATPPSCEITVTVRFGEGHTEEFRSKPGESSVPFSFTPTLGISFPDGKLEVGNVSVSATATNCCIAKTSASKSFERGAITTSQSSLTDKRRDEISFATVEPAECVIKDATVSLSPDPTGSQNYVGTTSILEGTRVDRNTLYLKILPYWYARPADVCDLGESAEYVDASLGIGDLSVRPKAKREQPEPDLPKLLVSLPQSENVAKFRVRKAERNASIECGGRCCTISFDAEKPLFEKSCTAEVNEASQYRPATIQEEVAHCKQFMGELPLDRGGNPDLYLEGMVRDSLAFFRRKYLDENPSARFDWPEPAKACFETRAKSMEVLRAALSFAVEFEFQASGTANNERGCWAEYTAKEFLVNPKLKEAYNYPCAYKSCPQPMPEAPFDRRSLLP